VRRILFLLAVAGFSFATTRAFTADWSPELAAKYLDARQEQWFSWKPAASANGPCVSCHTGMTYLLARPALRRALKEKEPTIYERGLLDRLRSNVGAKPPGALQYVETVFTAMFLAEQDGNKTMSADTRKAFDQLWTLQEREGALKGAWKWYAANLDPWENPGSVYYGASLAALAVSTTPPEYQRDASVRERIAVLNEFLSSSREQRPLHDRLALLWAASNRRDMLTDATRRLLVAETFEKQQADGGWTLESLGPWMPHPEVPAASGSNAYATSYTAFVLTQAGIRSSHPGLARALAWLKAHQDPKTGAWSAVSMNKRRPPDSMEGLFMQDAATAFASLALLAP
jgi:squalene-hopene/tetraprenyl-beta-curcumene cyclase